MTPPTIARNLHQARTDQGMTRGQLALRTGLGVRQIYQYETARTTPGAVNLALLCRALRVSSGSILGLGPNEYGPGTPLLARGRAGAETPASL